MGQHASLRSRRPDGPFLRVPAHLPGLLVAGIRALVHLVAELLRDEVLDERLDGNHLGAGCHERGFTTPADLAQVDRDRHLQGGPVPDLGQHLPLLVVRQRAQPDPQQGHLPVQPALVLPLVGRKGRRRGEDLARHEDLGVGPRDDRTRGGAGQRHGEALRHEHQQLLLPPPRRDRRRLLGRRQVRDRGRRRAAARHQLGPPVVQP
mmetsp:Transcript_66855/g.168851  ORF Transcript_66855/g.168851 Transcript_66855/m.168851 type:complete len:206 (-) Transcript_66855:97-714(-)